MLVAQLTACHSRSGSHTVVKWYASHEMQPDARRRCVGYSHLAYAYDVATFVGTFVDDLCSRRESLVHLLFRHCRFVEEIFCSPCNLLVPYFRERTKVVVHSHIYYSELEVVLATEHVYTSSAFREIYHLLPCHISWRQADSFSLYAVVTSKKQVAGVEESWEERMLHEAYPQCQFFEHSQRTFRLVQIVNLVLYFVLDAMVWRNYIEFYHDRIIFCLLYLHRNSAYS